MLTRQLNYFDAMALMTSTVSRRFSSLVDNKFILMLDEMKLADNTNKRVIILSVLELCI